MNRNGKMIVLWKILKNKWFLFAIAAIIILSIGNNIGNANAKVSLEEQKLDYNGILEKIKEKEQELTTISNQVDDLKKENEAVQKEKDSLQNEVSKRQVEFDEAIKIIKDKDNIINEIKTKEATVALKTSEIEKLDANITSKNEELAKVNQLIVEKKEEPIQLSAGTYIVGDDIPAGRYKAMPVGRGSNFVVYSSSGNLEVNTILGGTYGEPEYIFFTLPGSIIETHSQAKLIPVE